MHVGRKFAFHQATTDVHVILDDPSCNTVVVATRHDSHAPLVLQALAAGKHVFVEKPLCLTLDELTAIETAYTGEQLLTVGFNRRFSPLLIELHHQLQRLSGPKAFVYTCNAGAIPSNHWTQDLVLGGGRLLGEACHFVDLLRHLASSPIEDLQVFTAADRKPSPTPSHCICVSQMDLLRPCTTSPMAARPFQRAPGSVRQRKGVSA